MEKSKARSGGGGGGGGGAVNGGGGANTVVSVPNSNYKAQVGQIRNGFDGNGVQGQQMVVNNDGYIGINAGDEGFGGAFVKIEPMAEEFVPSLLANSYGYLTGPGGAAGFGFANNFAMPMEVVQFCEKYNLVQFQELFKEEGVVEHGL
ncbi:hypothetical protein S83_013830, partial [Arachis hypogaea]